jgi:argininosuccinate synthase
MRNLDIADSRAKLEQYAAQRPLLAGATGGDLFGALEAGTGSIDGTGAAGAPALPAGDEVAPHAEAEDVAAIEAFESGTD